MEKIEYAGYKFEPEALSIESDVKVDNGVAYAVYTAKLNSDCVKTESYKLKKFHGDIKHNGAAMRSKALKLFEADREMLDGKFTSLAEKLQDEVNKAKLKAYIKAIAEEHADTTTWDFESTEIQALKARERDLIKELKAIRERVKPMALSSIESTILSNPKKYGLPSGDKGYMDIFMEELESAYNESNTL